MRKVIASLLVILMVFGLLGCESNNSAPDTKAPVQEEPNIETDDEKGGEIKDPIDLMFISMASTTAIYTYSTTIANMLLDVLPPGSTIDVPETSPGGLTAQYSVINGDTDLVVMNGISLKWSMENENGVMDMGKVTGGVSSLVNGFDMPHITILFTKDFIDKTNCVSMEELVKNKVPANFYIKQKGNLGEGAFTQTLEALNTTEEDLISWGCTVTRDTAANIGTAFQDGLADITIDHLPNGQAATVQLTTNTECKVVGMSEETANALADKGWTKGIWKAGSSKFIGHDEDVLTVGAPNCLIARSDLDDDIAYLITKTVCENRDKLVAASAALEEFQPEKGGEILTEILHPGALRYYKEKGYIK